MSTDTFTVLRHTVRALVRSGLLGQVRPRPFGRAVRAFREMGSSAATLVKVAAIHAPDALAVIDERGTMTYGELDEAGAQVAAGLAHTYGIGPGRSVAVMCRNHRGFLLTTLAASRLGADLVFLNTEFSAPQLGAIFTRNPPDLVIADTEFLPRLDGHHITVIDAWSQTATPEHATLIGMCAGQRPGPRDRPVNPSTITILTSGTTGTPKGAPRKLDPLAVLGPTATVLCRTDLHVGDPVLIGPPLYHGFGLLTWALAVLLRSPVILHRGFDPEQALAAIARHKVGFVAAVPIMLLRILALPGPTRARYATGSLRTILSGGAPLRPELAERVLVEFGDVLFNGYGSTEIGIAAIATPQDLRAASGTVGLPTVGVPVRVLDSSGRPVPTGERGTIFVGGPMVFGGYTGGGNKQVVDGLMSTGDRGRLDAQGRLYVDGRDDDMIVSGGENVYPQEVEDTLSRHPAIADAAVIGIDDEEYGQRLVAYLVAADDAPSTAELRRYVKENLARYKVPRDFVFLDELPRNPTGKLVRGRLPAIGREPDR
jgi:acyl-CoA synthetase (AMP-forming)/AMP-acid ligase II